MGRLSIAKVGNTTIQIQELLPGVLSDEEEPVHIIRGRAGLRQQSTRAIREERRHVAI